MKFSHIILSLTLILTPLISKADEPTKAAHLKAHSQRHIARNTPSINLSPSAVGIESEAIQSQKKIEMKPVVSESARIVEDLLKEARKHIGKPYRAGSKGPSSFDCSGFSSYVYKQFGYKISPSSKAQALEGEKVASGDLRKGDLVFFTSRSSGNAVGHVGIVVEADNGTGNFSFIHASRNGITISKNEGYYKARYLGARRIIK